MGLNNIIGNIIAVKRIIYINLLISIKYILTYYSQLLYFMNIFIYNILIDIVIKLLST